jgi:hypothetical protein
MITEYPMQLFNWFYTAPNNSDKYGIGMIQ